MSSKNTSFVGRTHPLPCFGLGRRTAVDPSVAPPSAPASSVLDKINKTVSSIVSKKAVKLDDATSFVSSVKLPASQLSTVKRSVTMAHFRLLSTGFKGLRMTMQMQNGLMVHTDERTTFNRGTIDVNNVANIFQPGDNYNGHMTTSGGSIVNFYSCDRSHVAVINATRIYVAHARVVQLNDDGSAILHSTRFDSLLYVPTAVVEKAHVSVDGGKLRARVEQTVLVRFMLTSVTAPHQLKYSAVNVELVRSLINAPGVIVEVQKVDQETMENRAFVLLKDEFVDQYNLEYAPCNYMIAASRSITSAHKANDWFGRPCTLDMCHAEPVSDVGFKCPRVDDGGKVEAGLELFLFDQIVGMPWIAMSVMVDDAKERTNNFNCPGIAPPRKETLPRGSYTIEAIRAQVTTSPPTRENMATKFLPILDRVEERDTDAHPDPFAFIMLQLEERIRQRAEERKPSSFFD